MRPDSEKAGIVAEVRRRDYDAVHPPSIVIVAPVM
jgi:hypothetical protein